MVRDCSDFDKSTSHIEPRTPQLAMFQRVPTPDLLPGWRKFLVVPTGAVAKSFVHQHEALVQWTCTEGRQALVSSGLDSWRLELPWILVLVKHLKPNPILCA